MPFALKIFKIQIHNTYYEKGIGNDFEFVADEATAVLMKYCNIRLLDNQDTIEAMWLSNDLDDPLRTFKEKLAPHTLYFKLKVKNNNLFNFSELTIHPGTIYGFSNKKKQSLLHKEPYVGESDLITYRHTMNVLKNVNQQVVGLIAIDLSKIIHEKSKIDCSPLATYAIQIKNKEAIWCYHLVDVYQRIKNPEKLAIYKEDLYFIYKGEVHEMELNSNIDKNAKIYLYQSPEPIPLKNVTERIPFLKLLNEQKNNKKDHNLAAEALQTVPLPLPDVNNISTNIQKGGVFYTNMFFYV
jgi:hypothetical protein